MNELQGARFHITGVVQGVGFRPFVYNLARRLALTGWVRNTSAGVDIELDGPTDRIRAFHEALLAESPPLARMDEISFEQTALNGFTDFKIIHSQGSLDDFQPISPDVSFCFDCLRELKDPQNRR